METYTVTVNDDKTIMWRNSDGKTIMWRNSDGKLHRKDGPAIERANGTKYWIVNGNMHREDGPAIEYADGGKAWYVNGKNLTQEQFLAHTKRKQASCAGKVVEVDGKKYVIYFVTSEFIKLVEV